MPSMAFSDYAADNSHRSVGKGKVAMWAMTLRNMAFSNATYQAISF